VLASILDVLREGDINIEEVENIIFDGGLVGVLYNEDESSGYK